MQWKRCDDAKLRQRRSIRRSALCRQGVARARRLAPGTQIPNANYRSHGHAAPARAAARLAAPEAAEAVLAELLEHVPAHEQRAQQHDEQRGGRLDAVVAAARRAGDDARDAVQRRLALLRRRRRRVALAAAAAAAGVAKEAGASPADDRTRARGAAAGTAAGASAAAVAAAAAGLSSSTVSPRPCMCRSGVASTNGARATTLSSSVAPPGLIRTRSPAWKAPAALTVERLVAPRAPTAPR